MLCYISGMMVSNRWSGKKSDDPLLWKPHRGIISKSAWSETAETI